MIAQTLSSSAQFCPPAPAPRTQPLNFFQAVYTAYSNPIELWNERHYREPIVFNHSVFGRATTICAPEGIRRVLLDNVMNYRRDAMQRRLLTPALGDGVLTAEGDNWRRQRRSLAPLFTPRQVATHAHAVAETAVESTRKIRASVGQTIDMHDQLAFMTLSALEKTLFRQGLGKDAEEFQRIVSHYFNTIGRHDPLDLVGAPHFIPRLSRLRARPTLNWFRDTVNAIIEARRALIASGAEPPQDVLTSLLKAQDPETGLAMSEQVLHDNIKTFIGAGYETTATALSWTLYLLSQSPDWRARVEEEADSQLHEGPIETLTERTPIMRAVLEEAMRLYPPVAILSREAIEADEVCGFKIGKGETVIIPPFLVHRHHTLWRDPSLFDPERFMGENRDAINRFAYIPFGGGSRVCIGMGFAFQEMTMILAHLVHELRFDLAPNFDVRPLQRITLRPANGMMMRISARNRN